VSAVKLVVDDRIQQQTDGSGTVTSEQHRGDLREISTNTQLLTALDFEMDHLQSLLEESGPQSVLRQRAVQGRICLTVGLLGSAYDPMRALLAKRGFQVDSMSKARQALELTEVVAFDLILVRLPLADMELSEFLNSLRGRSSESSGAEVFLLADAEDTALARSFLGRGANRVIGLSQGTRGLEGSVGDRLRGADRLELPCSVMIYYKMGEFVSTQLCPVVNISETGLLVDTRQRIPNGHRFTFSLNIPELDSPLRGEAEVVRHVVAARDGSDGIGCKIVNMETGARERLRIHLARKLQDKSQRSIG
jgi:CheY-like chemotaxis protein